MHVIGESNLNWEESKTCYLLIQCEKSMYDFVEGLWDLYEKQHQQSVCLLNTKGRTITQWYKFTLTSGSWGVAANNLHEASWKLRDNCMFQLGRRHLGLLSLVSLRQQTLASRFHHLLIHSTVSWSESKCYILQDIPLEQQRKNNIQAGCLKRTGKSEKTTYDSGVL